MNENDSKKNQRLGGGIIFFIILVVIGVPLAMGMIANSTKETQAKEHEETLIREGKVKNHKEFIDEIAEILKDKNTSDLREYLSKDFRYYDNDNYEHKYVDDFMQDLKPMTSDFDIERRGDTKKDDNVTYRIYWDVIEDNRDMGKESDYYCLQHITIYLRKKVKENEITYEIQKIILKNT